MQVLKVSIKESILAAAQRLFLENGFSDVSLRMIARESGITVGNIYRYYESKEKIFSDLVDPVALFLRKALTHEPEPLADITGKDIFSRYSEEFREFSSILLSQKTGLVLLLEKNRGSRYEREYSNYVSMIADHLRDHLRALDVRIDGSPYNVFCDIMAHSFLQSLLGIVKTTEADAARTMLMQLISMFINSFPDIISLFGETV